ncbi:MAG: hypothetical protein DHS20C13_17520 [Thermodesulfobacteriota bacterium]|nr:MAG: hypothetical protein DHS20C13_17520 [Thermodesulfobacteriota bacterium]
MPLFEYECDTCMDGYNRDIDALVEKPNKTNAAKIKKNNDGILYVEITDDEKRKQIFALGEKSNRRGPRRFQYKISKNKVLYLELKDFRFSSLILDDKDEKALRCPNCNSKKPRRIFSTFKAIFDDKSKREPGPGDDLRWHMEYKEQKDEEQQSNWVGQDHLNQYFNR